MFSSDSIQFGHHISFPAGSFARKAAPDEPGTMFLDAFSIDQTEASIRDFEQFVRQGWN